MPAAARADAPQTVAGTAPATQSGARLQGAAPGSSKLSFAVTLPLRNASTLDALIASVSDPSSSQYGQYLTPTEFDSAFAPALNSVQNVESYLQSEGITITSVSSNRTVIDAAGSVANVQRAFGTTVGRYRVQATGREYTSNETSLSVPASIRPQVLGISGLDNRYLPAPLATPKVGGGPAGGYTPTQLREAYDVGPLMTAGDVGTGQTVGVYELAAFKQANITKYDTQYSLSPPTPVNTKVDGGTTSTDGEDEAELDIEVIQALAPKAAIKVFTAPNNDAGGVDAYNAIATSDTTSTNSTSWGLCEAQTSASDRSSEHQIFQQMAAQGQSLFDASGDSAAYDCGSAHTLGVDYPASDPDVTGVGGTSVKLSGNGYGSETTWDNSQLEGGGGGVSADYAKPTWQTGDGVPSTCASHRCVPDVSADADPNTGYAIYTMGAWADYGGTSAAAPLWAAVMTDYNQKAKAVGKPAIGFFNPALYSLAGAVETYPPFHDITVGYTSNAAHWPATTGYDLATGIGSPDVWNLARDLVASSSKSVAATNQAN